MRPATLHALDQAGAAADEAARLFSGIADALGTEPDQAYPGESTQRVLAGLAERALERRIEPCEHLRGVEPSHWCAWRPSRLRCLACVQTAGAAIHGRPEAHRCDACRRHAPNGFVVSAVLLPAAVVDFGDGPPLTGSPITVHYGLCRRCRIRDEATAHVPEQRVEA